MDDFNRFAGGDHDVNMPGQPSVLVVDDEAPISALLQKVLRKNGFEPTVAENGRSALEIIEVQDFEVVFLDIGLPDMSGMEVLQQICRQSPDTSVIMGTALADVHAAVEAMKLGASDYLTKPYDLDDLIARIEQVLERRYLAILAKDYHHRLEERVSDQSEQLQSMTTNAVQNLMRGITEQLEPDSTLVQGKSRSGGFGSDSREKGSSIFRRFGVGVR